MFAVIEFLDIDFTVGYYEREVKDKTFARSKQNTSRLSTFKVLRN